MLVTPYVAEAGAEGKLKVGAEISQCADVYSLISCEKTHNI